MNSTIATCPHCGKPLSSFEKLPWHLSHECTKSTQTMVNKSPSDNNALSSKK